MADQNQPASQATAADAGTKTGTDTKTADGGAQNDATKQQAQGTQTQQGKQTQTDQQKQDAGNAQQQQAKPIVPEKYEVKLPDGMQLDAKALEAYTPVLKELGLSNEGAQKLVDAQLKLVAEAQTAADEAFTTQVENWGKECKADKEFGGAAFDTNLALAQRAVAKVGGDELKKLLDDTGLGNHPEMFRMFARIGKMLGEDGGMHGGSGGASRDNTPVEERFYPKQK